MKRYQALEDAKLAAASELTTALAAIKMHSEQHPTEGDDRTVVIVDDSKKEERRKTGGQILREEMGKELVPNQEDDVRDFCR
jgi:hypothetical protein